MAEYDYKELNAVHFDTIKELSRIVGEQAKQLEQKHETCWKYITILIITLALFITIVICCVCGQRQNDTYKECGKSLELKHNFKIGGFPDTIKVQLYKE